MRNRLAATKLSSLETPWKERVRPKCKQAAQDASTGKRTKRRQKTEQLGHECLRELSYVAPSILFLAIQPTSNSRLTPPILLIFWPKNQKNAKNTNVGPLKETAKSQKYHFRPRPQTDFIRLASPRLILQALESRGPPVLRDGRFDRFLKTPGVIFNQIIPTRGVRKKWGGQPPNFRIVFSFLFFVHHFLENYTREPPLHKKGG